jgi:hypothetical protein
MLFDLIGESAIFRRFHLQMKVYRLATTALAFFVSWTNTHTARGLHSRLKARAQGLPFIYLFCDTIKPCRTRVCCCCCPPFSALLMRMSLLTLTLTLTLSLFYFHTFIRTVSHDIASSHGREVEGSVLAAVSKCASVYQ